MREFLGDNKGKWAFTKYRDTFSATIKKSSRDINSEPIR